MLLGDLIWRITGDTKEFDKKTKETSGVIGNLLKNFKTLGSLVQVAFAGAALAAVVNFGKKIVGLASDAEETQNKFNVVFSSISADAEQAAKDLEENYGLSSKASKQLLSDTGDLLTGFGFTQESALKLSRQVNTLAVDLASFTNFSGGAEGASAALTKALLGETESLKSLGIAILQTDIEQLAKDKGITGTLDRQTKAALTLELALKQSKNAIGDFARSQDSFANQSRIAQAETANLGENLGKLLLPAATDSVTIFGKLVGAINDTVSEYVKLRDATKAQDEGNVTTQQRIDLLKKEREEQGKLNATILAPANAIASVASRIAGVELRNAIDIQIAALTAQLEAEKKVQQFKTKAASDDAARAKKAADEATERVRKTKELGDLTKEIIEDDKTEYQSLQDVIDKLSATKFLTQEAEKERLLAISILQKQQGEIIQEQLDKELDRELQMRQIKRDAFNEEFEQSRKLADENEKAYQESIDKLKEGLNLAANFAGEASNLFSSIAGLSTALFDQRIEELDAQLARELESLGLAEETSIEKAERELADAKEKGDEEVILEKENALKKAKIEEEYAKKKRELDYQSATAAWQLQLLASTASLAQAVLNAIAEGAKFGPVGMAAYAGVAGLLGGIQLATVAAQKPVKAATGGMIPAKPGGTLVQAAENGGNELLLNDGNEGSSIMRSFARSLVKEMGGQSVTIKVPVSLDGRLIAESSAVYYNNGQVVLA